MFKTYTNIILSHIGGQFLGKAASSFRPIHRIDGDLRKQTGVNCCDSPLDWEHNDIDNEKIYATKKNKT